MLHVEEPAHLFETDWRWWAWVLVSVIFAFGYLVAYVAEAVALWAQEGRYRSPGRGFAKWSAYAVSGWSLLFVPGMLMRHLQDQSLTWWVVVPGLLLVGVLAVRAWFTDWALEQVVFGSLLLVGIVGGWINDSLTRFAASIPIGVGSLLALVAILVVGLVLKARSD